jgi:hypothetical protein
MLWNCPHCEFRITPKTMKSVKLDNEGGRRALQCPACSKEIEMHVHPAEYWQLVIPAIGFLFLYWASKNGGDAAMVMAGVVVAGGLVATMVVKKRVLGQWRRFRAVSPKA